MRARRPWSAYSLAAGMAFWSVMALGGGPGLFLSPDGSALGFDPAWLIHTPFSDFFLPGVLLALLGVAGAIVSALVIQGLRGRRRRASATPWQWFFALIVALGHVGWMTGEIVLMWSPVAQLPSSQKSVFYGFWWVFGVLSAVNLLLVFAPATRRILGGSSQRM